MYPSFRIAVLAVMVSRALAVPIPISSSSAADITELHAPTTTTTTIVDEVPEQTYLNYPTPVEDVSGAGGALHAQYLDENKLVHVYDYFGALAAPAPPSPSPSGSLRSSPSEPGGPLISSTPALPVSTRIPTQIHAEASAPTGESDSGVNAQGLNGDRFLKGFFGALSATASSSESSTSSTFPVLESPAVLHRPIESVDARTSTVTTLVPTATFTVLVEPSGTNTAEGGATTMGITDDLRAAYALGGGRVLQNVPADLDGVSTPTDVKADAIASSAVEPTTYLTLEAIGVTSLPEPSITPTATTTDTTIATALPSPPTTPLAAAVAAAGPSPEPKNAALEDVGGVGDVEDVGDVGNVGNVPPPPPIAADFIAAKFSDKIGADRVLDSFLWASSVTTSGSASPTSSGRPSPSGGLSTVGSPSRGPFEGTASGSVRARALALALAPAESESVLAPAPTAFSITYITSILPTTPTPSIPPGVATTATSTTSRSSFTSGSRPSSSSIPSPSPLPLPSTIRPSGDSLPVHSLVPVPADGVEAQAFGKKFLKGFFGALSASGAPASASVSGSALAPSTSASGLATSSSSSDSVSITTATPLATDGLSSTSTSTSASPSASTSSNIDMDAIKDAKPDVVSHPADSGSAIQAQAFGDKFLKGFFGALSASASISGSMSASASASTFSSATTTATAGPLAS